MEKKIVYGIGKIYGHITYPTEIAFKNEKDAESFVEKYSHKEGKIYVVQRRKETIYTSIEEYEMNKNLKNKNPEYDSEDEME